MGKVYLVVSGEYSDYRINRAFSTEDLAVAWAEKHNRLGGGGYTGYDIEEYDLDEPDLVPDDGYPCGRLVMYREGSVKNIEFERKDREQEAAHFSFSKPRDDGMFGSSSGHLRYWGAFIESDKERMIKAANEKRLQLIANNEWPIIEDRKGVEISTSAISVSTPTEL